MGEAEGFDQDLLAGGFRGLRVEGAVEIRGLGDLAEIGREAGEEFREGTDVRLACVGSGQAYREVEADEDAACRLEASE